MKIPIMDYDDRYFRECKYSKKDLFDMQEKILSMAACGSEDIGKDVGEITEVNDWEIQVCLRRAFSKGLVGRDRVGMRDPVPLYRYHSRRGESRRIGFVRV